MHLEITTKPLDPWRILSGYSPRMTPHDDNPAPPGAFGATVVFTGTMRDLSEGNAVRSMHIEHYPEMTQAAIRRAVEQVSGSYEIGDALVIHRVGDMLPGDTIVLVAVWASHRREAYEANRYIMEALKSTVPFWKRESLAGGAARWVEKNTPGGRE